MKTIENIHVRFKLLFLKIRQKMAMIRGDAKSQQALSCEYWALINWVRKKNGTFESASGPGSTLEATELAREFLEKIIVDYDVKSIVDIGCGDWNWMSHVGMSGVKYTGYDLVETTINNNKRMFGDRPGVHFKVANAITLKPPASDLVIIRDVLFHLSNENIMKVLENVKNSGSRMLLTTTFPQVTENVPLQPYGDNLCGWGYHDINLEKPPFNLSNSVEQLEETAQSREMRLYVLEI